MITTWILIIAMNTGGYGQTSQKVENIQSQAECISMGKSFGKQMDRSEFACIPKTVYGDK